MNKCIDYYKKESDFINFNDTYMGNTLYIDKLKTTLISKFPRDESETVLWRFIREGLGCTSEEKESLLSIPTVSKANLLPNLNTPVSLSSNLMLPTDISGLLFNSGKFPSASSLLGLPDPLAHSTLAANNMFLSTNLFKMQELLKPLSTSSPIQQTKSKNDSKSTSPLKIPTDIKGIKASDFQMDLMNLKSKMEFASPDQSLTNKGKEFSPMDYLSNLKGNSSKHEFSIPDLSKSSSEFSLNLSKQGGDSTEKMPKIPKLDYSTLDLSVSKNSSIDTTNPTDAPTDLSVNTNDNTANNSTAMEEDDKPLNLAGE